MEIFTLVGVNIVSDYSHFSTNCNTLDLLPYLIIESVTDLIFKHGVTG
jgi:hypothetical protein